MQRSPCTGCSKWRGRRTNRSTEEVTFAVQGPEGERVRVSGRFDASTKCITFDLSEFLAPCVVNPYFTTTYGVGELLLESVVFGAQSVLLELPGKFPYDGGMGMLTALGVRFFDVRGRELTGIGDNLRRVVFLDFSAFLKKPKSFSVLLAPGERGEGTVEGIEHFARVLMLHTGVCPLDFRKVSGIGMSLSVFWDVAILERGEVRA